jgi:hypothetical protein
MVDLRTKPVYVQPDARDETPVSSITPPHPDLMARLKQEFAPYIIGRGHAGDVANEAAEMRGAWLVINFMESIVNSHQEGA